MLPPSGLFSILNNRPYPLPLHHSRIDASIYDLCAEITLHQIFVNDAPPPFPPLDCFYTFPLHEDSAVFSFVCDLDGVVSRGTIKEKNQARAEYDSAVSQHRSAMLLEQSADNVFQCRIGVLSPGSVCTITITYLTLLDQEGRSNRFTLPMIVAPKYTPGPHGPTPPFEAASVGGGHPTTLNNRVHSGLQCNHCLCTPIIGTRHRCTVCTNYDLCDGCRMRSGVHDTNHPMLAFTNSAPIRDSGEQSVDYPLEQHKGDCVRNTAIEGKFRNLTVNVNVRMPSRIISIRCPSHAQETRIQQEPGSDDCTATVSFHSTDACSLSCDFILLIEQERCFEPRVLCELNLAKRSAAISLAFVPPVLDMLSASQLRCELIFLIDCSGSMQGPSISCVRECMQILLHSLPVNSRFNIISFGSSWSSLFSSSQVYDDKSLSAATEYVTHLRADLGGTEIYPPLHHALTSSLLHTHPRQIFLLTDGKVTNVQQLAQLVSQYAASTRLFTFGIGTSTDRALCKKLAEAGRGKCEFVTATDAQRGDMREKVVRQVTRAMQPMLTDVKVDWRDLNPDNYKEVACSDADGRVNASTPCEGVTTASASSSTGYIASPCSTSFLQCPSIAPAIFMNSRYLIHAVNAKLPDTVWQQVQAGQPPTLQMEIEITGCSNHPREADYMRKSVLLTGRQITQAAVIHTLAARARIRELENLALPQSNMKIKRELENEILQLALQYTLTSSKTSFVVVYKTGQEEEVFCRSHYPATFRRQFLRCRGAGASVQSFSCSAMAQAEPTLSYRPCRSVRKLQILRNCAHTSTRVLGLPVEALQSEGNSGKSKHEVSEAEASPFEALIKLQTAGGVWNLTPMLIKVVSAIQPSCTFTVQSLQEIGTKYGVEEQVVGVLFVLDLLYSHFKERQTEWQMLATKAQYFVNEHAHINQELQEEIKENIRKQMA